MAKRAQNTKILIDGKDISGLVLDCGLPRFPGEVESVTLSLAVAELNVLSDGTLVILINTTE